MPKEENIVHLHLENLKLILPNSGLCSSSVCTTAIYVFVIGSYLNEVIRSSLAKLLI